MDIICIIIILVCVQVSGSSGALPLTPVVGEQGSSQCSLPLLLPAKGQFGQPDAAGSHQPAVLCLARRHCQRCLSPAASQLRPSSDVQVGDNGVQMCILYHVSIKVTACPPSLFFPSPLSTCSLSGADISELCSRNASVAALLDRPDLVRAWSVTALVANSELPVPADPSFGDPWSQHPFSRQLIYSL